MIHCRLQFLNRLSRYDRQSPHVPRYLNRIRCSRLHTTHVTSLAGDTFKILFFGRDEFSCTVLRKLHQEKDVWQDLSVVTQPDVKTGRRGSKVSVSPLKVLSQQLEIPVHFIPHDKTAFKTWQPPLPFFLEPHAAPPANHMLITASFGRILPNSLLRLFLSSRRLNVHPSLLPAYRGAAPIQHALIDGQREAGVCVIEMMERKKGIDAGAIWGRRSMDIPANATFPKLRDKLAEEGSQLLVSVLRDMLARKAISEPQATDPSAPRAPAITADDAVVDLESMTADQIVRRHRGISHQKPLFVFLKNSKTLQLHSPAVYASQLPYEAEALLTAPGTAIYHPPSASLIIRCASNTLLSVPQVKQQDRSLLNAKEWWNGVRPEMRIDGAQGPVCFLRRCVEASTGGM